MKEVGCQSSHRTLCALPFRRREKGENKKFDRFAANDIYHQPISAIIWGSLGEFTCKDRQVTPLQVRCVEFSVHPSVPRGFLIRPSLFPLFSRRFRSRTVEPSTLQIELPNYLWGFNPTLTLPFYLIVAPSTSPSLPSTISHATPAIMSL